MGSFFRDRKWKNSKQPIRTCWKSGKPIYDKRTAATARNKRWRDDRVELRIYPCPHCRGWHLTKRVKEREEIYE